MRLIPRVLLVLFAVLPLTMLGMGTWRVAPAAASSFSFSTGSPDGKIGTLSRPASPGLRETETADDFLLTQLTQLTSATLTGLLPSRAPLSSIQRVEIEFYHVFPKDSDISRTSGPPTFSTVNVPTRVNSPADVEIASATRDSAAGTLTFSPSLVNSNFSVLNTVVNGINAKPNQFTGGEGAATGKEVLISGTFTTPVDLPAGRYFFRPEVRLADGNFLWLSAPFTPGKGDLQSWIRNDDGLAPDWLRIGTDITKQGPFNASFSLSGAEVPEPSTLLLVLTGLSMVACWRRVPRG